MSIIQTMDGHPEVGSPKTSVLIMINTMKINATMHINIPKKDASASGAVENPIIPSKE